MAGAGSHPPASKEGRSEERGWVPELAADDAESAAQRVRAALEGEPFTVENAARSGDSR